MPPRRPPHAPPPPPRRPNFSKVQPQAESGVTGASTHGPSGAAKEENVYIPAFISKRPFYAGTDDQADYLDHQRSKKSKTTEGLENPAATIRAAVPTRTKYKKGACENCGAEGHKAKDCLHRQRKKGAKWSGQDIQADDTVRESAQGWDAKRDRWYNYDPREYKKTVVERYEEMEELKRLAVKHARQARRESEVGDFDDDADDVEAADDGDKYAEEVDMGKHQPTSTKQLRIREDTAKYLLNLDLESAKYDPKTRALVNSGAMVDKAATAFAEEGFLRASGDAAEFERAQRYAWESQEKKGDSSQHLQANPTAGELHRRKLKEEAEEKRLARAKELEQLYGASEVQCSLPQDPRQMAVEQSETFVEYDELGLVKGAPRTMAKSKYPEDVLVNNHTSVWGSWWDNFSWGYKCCHSFVKNSYCTGIEGIRAREEAERQRSGVGLVARHNADDEHASAEPVDASTSFSNKTREGQRRYRSPEESEFQSRVDFTGEVKEQEMEEYRRNKAMADDPMAKFLGRE